MTEKSWYWPETGGGDGGTTYSDDEFTDNWRYLFMVDRAAQGVIPSQDFNDLEVTGTNSPVSVDTGIALVDGKLYRNDASLDLDVSTPSSSNRKDRLVLRKDWAAQTVRAVVIEGTEGSGSFPSITQTDGTTWDFIIAEWTIDTGGNITISKSKGAYCYSAISLLWALLTKKSPADNLALIRDSAQDMGFKFGLIDTPNLANDSVDYTKLADPYENFYYKVVTHDVPLEVGDGQIQFTIPEYLDGKDIYDFHIAIYDPSSSGQVEVQLRNITKGVDVLSTPATIDQGEYNSFTAATQPVVDGSNNTVNTGDRMAVDVDQAGTDVLGLDVVQLRIDRS